MAQLYADEDFPFGAVEELRQLGHDILTAAQSGHAGSKDPVILAFATNQGRAVVTHNRRHFIRLHRQDSNHCGIIVCTQDTNWPALANRIHQAIVAHATLNKQLIRVYRPAKP